MSVSRLMQMGAAGYVPSGPVWTDPDLANASYDSVSLGISGQNQFPTGLFLKDDGTKVYMLGQNTVYQYALSTAWDISTGSYESKSFDSGTQTSFSEAVSFKSDGTIMYVTSRATTDAIYQYTLSTAWDVSTASYASKYLDVTSQEANPRAAYFKPDGSKVYVTGTGNDTIYQYALSTAWDVSTGSFETGKSFSVSSQEGSPQSLYFSPSGDKVWTIGTVNQTVYQYSLSTAWDISTASYDSVSFSVSSQDTSVKELFYKNDGSKLYVVGDTNDNIYQYST
jgi:6-phosphogluconolactonase (cycloisomerase 2 family)